MEADFGGVAGLIVDGEEIEAAGAVRNVALGEKTLRGAGDDALFIGGDAEFGQRGEFFAERARADFYEGQDFTVVADEIEFAFDAARRVIARDEDVAVAAEIPVGVGFAADAGTAGGVFALGEGIIVIFAQAFARGPVDELEDSAGD